ncbi:MAG: phosphate acyltransferase PlsX [Deltaproteobacteria bacterium]|nr:phosphate acyltransferase PlsX [Deltaproteobacteria bacterium]
MSDGTVPTGATMSTQLPVAVDAMGADFGPAVVVEGAVAAARQLNLSSIIVGDEEQIRARLKSLNAEADTRISVRNATQVVTMDDSPSTVMRKKPDASIRVAFELVKQKVASGVVSPGNTGAVMAAGIFVAGTAPGIVRPAIASLIPKSGPLTPTVLLDSGANIGCNANQLVQFALMGNYYARTAISCERPRIALLSNGTELSKGTDIIRSAAQLLGEMKELNFVGYVEGRDICRDVADVVVCDGFVGNVLLKAMEGTVELVFDSIKHYIEGSLRGKIGMGLAKPMFKMLFREKLDPSSYGGAPLLGLNEIAIICHGSSNSRAIMNAIRVAQKSASQNLASELCAALTAFDMRTPGTYDDGIWNRMGQRFEKRSKSAAVANDPSDPSNKEESK